MKYCTKASKDFFPFIYYTFTIMSNTYKFNNMVIKVFLKVSSFIQDKEIKN
jgi:hypothetical protein